MEQCQGVFDVISILPRGNHPLPPEGRGFQAILAQKSAKNDDRKTTEVWRECHFCGNALAEIAEAIAGQSGVIFEEARVVFSKRKNGVELEPFVFFCLDTL